jgi:hypothetical protein
MGWSCCSNGPATTLILIAKSEGGRERGKTKLRWEDGMDNDVKALEEGKWENLARNRQIWQNHVRKAVAQQGLFANDDGLILYWKFRRKKVKKIKDFPCNKPWRPKGL